MNTMTVQELIDALTEASFVREGGDLEQEVFATTIGGEQLTITGIVLSDEGVIKIAVRP